MNIFDHNNFTDTIHMLQALRSFNPSLLSRSFAHKAIKYPPACHGNISRTMLEKMNEVVGERFEQELNFGEKDKSKMVYDTKGRFNLFPKDTFYFDTQLEVLKDLDKNARRINVMLSHFERDSKKFGQMCAGLVLLRRKNNWSDYQMYTFLNRISASNWKNLEVAVNCNYGENVITPEFASRLTIQMAKRITSSEQHRGR